LVARGITFLLTVSWILLLSGTTFAATYYIDCVGGVDSNSGTSKSSPWLHHPYMTGWGGKYTHAAGDHFIFKGGVVCPVGYLPLTLGAGGTSGNPDFYGADMTWYTGGGWARPIFDGGQTGPSGSMFDGTTLNYWTVDSIEFRNQGFGDVFQYAIHGTGIGVTANNVYVHAWHLTSTCTSGMDAKQGGISLVYGIVSNSIIDGSDVTDTVGHVTLGGAIGSEHVTGSTIHDTSNAILIDFVLQASNNLIYNIAPSCDPTMHGNAIENVGDDSQRNEIYDNIIYNANGGVCILVEATSDIYNNVIYSNGEYDIQIGITESDHASVTANVYNNTLQSTGGLVRVLPYLSIGTLNLQNNHFITDGAGGSTPYCTSAQDPVNCAAVIALNVSNNVTMTNATAGSQGYTSSESHPYSPTSGSNGTVGAGLNLTSSCSTLTALCSDILGISRPSSGAWDVGAYLFTGAGAPNPPTSVGAKAN